MQTINVRDVAGMIELQGVNASTIVYVGRPNPRYVFTEYGSVLANPHRVGHCSFCGETHTREEAITAFKRGFWRRFASDRVFRMTVIRELDEKEYVACWCKPKPCHADVLVEFWAWLQTREGQERLIGWGHLIPDSFLPCQEPSDAYTPGPYYQGDE